MPDHYILESGAPDGYLLEDGSGVLLMNFPSCYRDTVLADAPIGYWRLGEATGTVAVDIGSANNPGTYTGSPALGTAGLLSGDNDTSVHFVAASLQYVAITDHATLDMGNGPVAYETWLQRANGAATGTMVLMGKGVNAPQLEINGTVSGEIYWYSQGVALGAHSSVLIADTNIHHIVGTKDTANSWRLYLDGVEVTVTDSAATTASNATNLNFARQADGFFYLGGDLDEVAIYNYVLTPTQVATHYAAAVTRCPPLPRTSPYPQLLPQ